MVYARCVFLLLSIVASSYTPFALDIPKCNRDVSLIDNFDPARIKGTWYAFEVGDEQKSMARCLTARIVSEPGTDNRKLWMNETGYVNGKLHERDINFTQISNSRYLAKSKEFAPTIISVIDTDYVSYSTWYQCANGHMQDGVIYFGVRSKKPSTETIKKGHDSIIKAGFKVDKADLFAVDLSNC